MFLEVLKKNGSSFLDYKKIIAKASIFRKIWVKEWVGFVCQEFSLFFSNFQESLKNGCSV